jgi:hypothetical protein
MIADKVCLVCRWLGPGAAVCERCNWEPAGRNRGTRLADRQRDHDLGAAARVASATASGDRVLLAWLADLVRGGPLQPDQVEQAAAKLEAADPLHPTSAGIMFALTRLIAGQTGATTFVEIGPDEMSAHTLVVNSLGVPVRLATDSLPWTAILRMLPAFIALRYLWMAGGVGVTAPDREDADPAALMAAVNAALPPVLARFTTGGAQMAVTGRLDTVLVNRTRDWPLLEAAAARARAVMRPVAEIVVAPSSGTPADIVDAAAARAPLRYDYDLVVIDVDARTGVIRPQTCELFPAGAVMRPGIGPVRTVDVAPVSGHAASRLALPIVARRGPAADLRDPEILREHRPLIAMAALDTATEGPVQVRVELAGPGLARLVSSSALLPADALPVGWPELMGELPERLPAAGLSSQVGLDLVILVELGEGRQAAVAARIRLARGVVRAFRGVSAARIAVLGYREHFSTYLTTANGVPGREHEAFVVGSVGGLSTPAEALALLRRDLWQAVPVGHDHAAPLEEPLLMIASSGEWGWRSGARHVLLVVGCRPPHPKRPGLHPGRALPCPFHYSWQYEFARLRDDQEVECFAVLDRLPEHGYPEQAWRELTAAGHYWSRSGVTASRLAGVFGLTPPSPAQLRLSTLAGQEPPTVFEGRAAE